MSAFAGIVGMKTDRKEIEAMVDAMRHRGPDRVSFRELDKGAVAVRELDVSGVSTPGLSSAPSPTVLLDGEIYNDRADGTSNVDVIADLYRAHGKDCFRHIEGSYACAVIDGDEIILARDSVGSRPVIYNRQNGIVCFASEAKGLIGRAEKVDELPPRHWFSSKEGVNRFDDFAPDVPEYHSPEQAAKDLEELLVEATRKRMADGSAGAVSLSGGLDSSIIAAIAKSIDPSIHLFSTTIKRYPSKDLEFAKLMAKHVDCRHTIYEISDDDIKKSIPDIVWYMETFDEDCVSGAIANYYTSKMIAQHSRCVLVGEGADELFGGYFRELKKIDSEEEKKRIAQKLVDVAYNSALRRLDRGWLSNSVNYRTPFLAPEVVAFSMRIPISLKHHYDEEQGRDVEKWILRKAFQSWLPAEIYARPKLRFAGGTGVDDLMDELTREHVDTGEFANNGTTASGMKLNSPKELYYYRLFTGHFPAGFENMTARWDPFK
ncbi:MAG: hypothetical protein GF418_15735 [Chitinivibrionales bacterium]|nr:hypothetical protein [Chitinivibrionales bacterium]MBD3397073.1 hypothetical protein [Chitinivibrionales bacterium]